MGLGRNRFFGTIDQACGHADGGAAGRHVDRDDRAGADFGKVAHADVAQQRCACESSAPRPILGARPARLSFLPMVTFCRIVTSSPISTKAPPMIPVA